MHDCARFTGLLGRTELIPVCRVLSTWWALPEKVCLVLLFWQVSARRHDLAWRSRGAQGSFLDEPRSSQWPSRVKAQECTAHVRLGTAAGSHGELLLYGPSNWVRSKEVWINEAHFLPHTSLNQHENSTKYDLTSLPTSSNTVCVSWCLTYPTLKRTSPLAWWDSVRPRSYTTLDWISLLFTIIIACLLLAFAADISHYLQMRTVTPSKTVLKTAQHQPVSICQTEQIKAQDTYLNFFLVQTCCL